MTLELGGQDFKPDHSGSAEKLASAAPLSNYYEIFRSNSPYQCFYGKTG